ncbi:MAG: glycosyltransferase family 4 protein [Chloroflexota bacterium]
MILRLTWAGNFWYSGLMRLLFVADGRSPIALNWIRYFVERGDDVFLASTFVCSPDVPLQELEITPVAYSANTGSSKPARRGSSALKSLTALRHLLGPLTIPRAARKLRAFADRVRPDLVHAMRIPFEGMLAADACGAAPLLVSVWGNDFTLHAPSTALMRHYTTWTLRVADALHADCRRDIRLAREWGLAPGKPTLVSPGGGGIQTAVFFAAASPPLAPTVINARGSRAYVRNDIFFTAIPLVLERRPDVRFSCVALEADREAMRWVDRLRIGHAVQLLPQVSQGELADMLRRAQVMVSPSIHDGTPNSLLEGMACGCFPIAGDLESIREWITHGENGLLVDATNPGALAHAILQALENENLRRQAAGLNQGLILQRAQYARCMSRAREFYAQIIAGSALTAGPTTAP